MAGPRVIDASEVAEIGGLASNRAVSTYRQPWDEFPSPIVQKGSGMCLLWLRRDIVAWAKSRSG